MFPFLSIKGCTLTAKSLKLLTLESTEGFFCKFHFTVSLNSPWEMNEWNDPVGNEIFFFVQKIGFVYRATMVQSALNTTIIRTPYPKHNPGRQNNSASFQHLQNPQTCWFLGTQLANDLGRMNEAPEILRRTLFLSYYKKSKWTKISMELLTWALQPIVNNTWKLTLGLSFKN